MLAPFAEAVRATAQPCTFLLIVPIAVGVAAARLRWQAFVAAAIAAILGGWLLAANRFLLEGVWLRVSGALVIAALAMIVVPQVSDRLQWAGRAQLQVAVAGAVAFIAALWWRPCVGEELGVILSGAQNGLAGQLLPMAAYMLGAVAPVGLLVLLRYALGSPDRYLAVASLSALAIGVVVAGSLALGRHDDVVVTLTRWTLE